MKISTAFCTTRNAQSPTHTHKKDPFLPSLKKIRCVTREEKLFQIRARRFQHSSMTPTRAEHLTLARNSSFSPLVAQYTISSRYCGKTRPTLEKFDFRFTFLRKKGLFHARVKKINKLQSL